MGTQPSSLLDKILGTVYIEYVLKVLGFVLLGLALFNGWHHLTLLEKTGFISGPLAWFVGSRFNKIYR